MYVDIIKLSASLQTFNFLLTILNFKFFAVDSSPEVTLSS